MKTNLHVMAAGVFLAATTAGFGQSTIQFVVSSCSVPDWASSTAVPDWAGPLRLVVQRRNDINTEVSVDYTTADGTAIAGLKYDATNGTLVFAPGETNQTIVVQLLDSNEGLVESTQTFDVILSNPTNAVLGAPTTSTVSILNVDVGIQFQFANYNTTSGWPVPQDACVWAGRAPPGCADPDSQRRDQGKRRKLQPVFNTAPDGPDYSGLGPYLTLNYSCTTPLPTNGLGNIINAPLFVDYAGGDLRLQPNSSCLNAGNNSCLTNCWFALFFTNSFDLDGNPGVISGTVDIGAEEYQGPGSVVSYAWLRQLEGWLSG